MPAALGWIESAISQRPDSETEPNAAAAQATPLSGSNVVVRANVFPTPTDVDVYRFAASAGDRVYAATQTGFSADGTDTVLELLGTDGMTVLESDNNDGVVGGSASSIAGASLAAAGTYYLRVRNAGTTNTIRPYDLHFRLQSGTPVAETEPNDSPGQALPPSGWVSGGLAMVTDVDQYTLTLNAGDTVYASLDLDPERDGTEWNGQLSIGPFGPGSTFLLFNDAGGAAGPDSEALLMTVQAAGTYTIRVNAAAATFGTYHLSVSVHPATPATMNCTTYTSTDVPKAISATGAPHVTSTLTIPGNPRIADLDVTLRGSHASPADLDVHLISPQGNTNALFTDVGSAMFPTLDLTIDDQAGIPIGFNNVQSGVMYQPEVSYRLHWFQGEDAGGTWTLVIDDDTTANGGTLTSWSLTVCEPAPFVCPTGGLVSLHAANFDAADGGYTHSGIEDEWARGLPTLDPITTCNGGSAGCWKTDLTDAYNDSSNQDLVSPNIDLAGAVIPVRVSWSMKYQIESASFDHASVVIREVGGANPRILWQHLDATMTTIVGATTLQESAGWGQYSADVSEYVGKRVELVFHLDSDDGTNLAGLAVDDVRVTHCPIVCGNSTLEGTEQCDLGPANGQPGSCCSETCQLVPADTQCRPAAAGKLCDAPEVCTGMSPNCPADGFLSSGTTCRPAVPGNVCDQAEVCSGMSPDCPADIGISSTTTVCRPAAPGKLCDATESCDGMTPSCPTDGFLGPSSTCRPAVPGNVCDQAEVCSGMSPDCPADIGTPNPMLVCRPAAPGRLCDAPETCDGMTPSCPADGSLSNGTTCRPAAAGKICDVAESCNGTSLDCPADVGTSNTSLVCRPAAIGKVCDKAENCDGMSPNCPVDGFLTSITPCRNARGPCDLAEACNGTSADCPPDRLKDADVVCRPAGANLTCDPEDLCDGVRTTCPARYAPAGTTGPTCMAPSQCSGTGSCG